MAVDAAQGIEHFGDGWLQVIRGPRFVVANRTSHREQTRRTPTREVRSRRKVLFPRFIEAHYKFPVVQERVVRSQTAVVALGDDNSPEAKMLRDILKKAQRLDVSARFHERAKNK